MLGPHLCRLTGTSVGAQKVVPNRQTGCDLSHIHHAGLCGQGHCPQPERIQDCLVG